MSEIPPSSLGSVPPSQTPSSYGASGSFRQWAIASAVCEKADQRAPKIHREDFDRIVEYKVPKNLGKLTSQTFYPIEAKMLQEARGLPPDMLSDDDPYEVRLAWGSLCLIRQILEKSKRTEDDMNEASKGLVPTLLLQVVFARHGDQRQVKEQETIRLPRPREDRISTLATLPGPSAVADLLIASLEARIPSNIEDGPFYKQLAWQDIAPTSDTSVIVFVAEYKSSIVKHNVNQLLMYFATAQHQRRALGLEDSVVYGATYAASAFCVYASYWQGRKIHWHLVALFELRKFEDLINCYTCLCKIADNAKGVEDMLQNLSGDDLKKTDHQNNNKWRADSPPPEGKRPPDQKDSERSSNSKSRRTGGTENMEDSGGSDSAPHTDDDVLALVASDHGEIPKGKTIEAWLSTLDTSEVPRHSSIVSWDDP